MKLSVTTADLLKAVQAVFPAIERKNANPVLSNLLVQSSTTETRLTATDLELELAITVPLPAEQPGDITLPAKRIQEVLRALPGESTVVITTEDSKAMVKSGRSRFVLQTLPADDYPAPRQQEFDVEIIVSQAELAKALTEATYAASHNDVRYYLNGCLFDFAGNHQQVNIVSTDGHRLAFRELHAQITRNGDSLCAILPTKGLQALTKLLKTDTDALVTLQIGKSHLRVTIGETRLTSILIDGKYPDYWRVIPKEPTKIVIADREKLIEVLRRAKIILADNPTSGARLTLTEWLLTVNAHNSNQEEAEEEMEINYTGDSLEIGFNADYLVEALTAIPGETVRLGLTDSQCSMLLEEGNGLSGKHVVMPIRL
jgi:DNA polymerase III subunit beta